MTLKKQFNVVFQPKDAEIYGKRRFMVSINRLHNYIGLKNANKAILTALKLKDDSIRIRYRKFGIIDIYCK